MILFCLNIIYFIILVLSFVHVSFPMIFIHLIVLFFLCFSLVFIPLMFFLQISFLILRFIH